MSDEKLRELVEKWVKHSKENVDDNYLDGMAYQAGVCADELAALLAQQPAPEREAEASIDHAKPHIERPECAEVACERFGWNPTASPAEAEKRIERIAELASYYNAGFDAGKAPAQPGRLTREHVREVVMKFTNASSDGDWSGLTAALGLEGQGEPQGYEESLMEACSEILKTVMEAMADPEGGIGIDQVYALVDGRIGRFVRRAAIADVEREG